MAIRGCVLHGANDLRYEEVPDEELTQDSVRVRLGAGGICGSDQHYFKQGRMGNFLLRHPLVLGHEMSGDVIAAGSAVTNVKVGDRIVVDPAKTCGRCHSCREGRQNLCENVEFMGSASRYPHLPGGFRDEFVVESVRCIKVSVTAPHELLVFTEPLSVALHAVQRAGSLFGKKVLVAGAGTIGTLISASAKAAGASEVVVTDLSASRRRIALDMGADRVLDPDGDADAVKAWDADGGAFDVAFEATGSRPAFQDMVKSTRRGGKVVLVGMIPSSDCHVPFHHMTTREIDLVSTFRQNRVFDLAAQMLVSGAIDPRPILTARYPLAECLHAFDESFDREKNIKVVLLGSKR